MDYIYCIFRYIHTDMKVQSTVGLPTPPSPVSLDQEEEDKGENYK